MILSTMRSKMTLKRGTDKMARFTTSIKTTDTSIDDRKAVLDLTLQCLKNTGGRPFKFTNDEIGLKSFTESCRGYFEYLRTANSKLDENQGLIASVEGLCSYVGITRNTLSQYHKRSPEWSECIDYIKNHIANIQMDLAFKNKINPTLMIWNGCNNYGYLNTNQFTLAQVIADTSTPQEDDANIESKMSELGLTWDENLKEWT